MKTLAALLSIVFAVTAFAADDLRTVKTVDLAAITEKPAAYEGQLVKLKFGWRDGTQLAYREAGKNAKVEAIVPPEGESWFNGVTTQIFSTRGVFVYARIIGGKAKLEGVAIKPEASTLKLSW